MKREKKRRRKRGAKDTNKAGVKRKRVEIL